MKALLANRDGEDGSCLPERAVFTRDRLYTVLFTLFLGTTILQNFLAILLSRVNYSVAQSALLAKDAYIALVILTGFWAWLWQSSLPGHRARVRVRVLVVLGVMVYLLLVALVSPGSNLMSLRQLMTIPLLMLFGEVFVGRVDIRSIIRAIFPLLVCVVLTGFFERFFLVDDRESFWAMVGITDYMKMKGFERWAYGPGGTPGNFYSWDFASVLGGPLRRMVSLLLAEPTLLGQLLLYPVVAGVLARRRQMMAFFALALLLTLSKGGVIGVAVALGLHRLMERRGWVMKVGLLIAGCAGCVGVVLLAYTGTVSSLFSHFLGLVNSFLQLVDHPLGRGIGMAGNFAFISAANSGDGATSLGLEGTGESYLGILVGQLGVVGLGLYFFLFWRVWRLKVPAQPTLMALKYAIMATLVGGIASESSISYVGSGYLFALLPMLFSASGQVQASEGR